MAARVATDEAETTSGPEEEAAWAKARQTREEVSKLIGQYLLKGYRMLDASCTDCGSVLLQLRGGRNYCVYCQEVAKAAPTMGSGQSSTGVSSSSPEHSHSLPTTPKLSGTSSTSPPPPPTTSGSTDTADSEHTVPVVSSGRTGDTFKMTTTPAADHDRMRFSSDTKCTGRPRTNPGIIQSMGTKKTPPSSAGRLTDKSSPNRLEKEASKDCIDLPPQAPTITSLQEASLECQSVLVAKLKWCARELDASQSLENSILLCRLVSSIGEALKALREGPLSSLAPPPPEHSTDT